MQSLGYKTLELLLTPLQFGIPNSRLRYYFLAKKDPLQFMHTAVDHPDRVWRHIPGQGQDWVDDRFDDSTEANLRIPCLSSYLDGPNEVPSYSIPDKVLFKWGRFFDVIYPSSRRSCCFTRGESTFLRSLRTHSSRLQDTLSSFKVQDQSYK
jgi:tRNA (cytosine38-C5)-methyltransferase